jgi:hypothetical protein
MNRSLVRAPIVFTLIMAATAACAASGLSDREKVIEQVVTTVTGTFSIPTGQTRVTPADLATLQNVQAAGLITLREIPRAYWDSFMNRTQGLGTAVELKATEKLLSMSPEEVPVQGANIKILRIKIADDRIDELTTDSVYAGPLSTPGEQYRIMLGTYKHVPTSAAAVLGPKLAAQSETRLKFRCIVKYNQFAKVWTVVAFDTGERNTEAWRSSNVR